DEAWRRYADDQWVDGDNRFLGFRRASAGRGILVDYDYYDTSTATKREVRGEFHRIPVERAAAPTYAAFPYEVRLNVDSTIAAANLQTEIIRVRGSTVRARVYWNEDGKWRAVQIERQTPLRAG
ncbi:MAG: hypothetical protein COZ06_23795, partial [Armatimonadetes bacterium CG_4_10_14_3_um_filter_66_18]